MNDPKQWTVPKWPFLAGDAALLAAGFLFIERATHPIGQWEIVTAAACVGLGAVLGALPYILDYYAVTKVIEAGALGAISDKIQDLEKLAAQISAATAEWLNVQTQAESIANGANAIAGRMADEVRQFSEFMQKMNDTEKAALRLEVEKLRRVEGEWMQALVRVLDHVFTLHAAAVRTGQPKLAEQIAHFQNACRDAARRVGLTPFEPAPDEPFDATRHEPMGDEIKPDAETVVGETAAPGYSFQGRLLRSALVRLRQKNPAAESAAAPAPAPAPAPPPEAEPPQEQLPLGSAE